MAMTNNKASNFLKDLIVRQVPQKYLIIGNGRMAKHFCHYLRLLNLSFTSWSRATGTEQSLHVALQQASHVIVLISDAAIPQFVKQWQKDHQDKIWVHFSGQLNHPTVFSAHPLMSFANELYDLATYHCVPFVLTQDTLPFNQLLPSLPNKAHAIPADLKTFYHAMCVISGNFTSLVWNKFFNELQNLGVPRKIAIPYLQKITQNLINDPKNALTGPLVRGDQSTIRAHLKALEDDDFLPIYQAVLEYFKNKETA